MDENKPKPKQITVTLEQWKPRSKWFQGGWKKKKTGYPNTDQKLKQCFNHQQWKLGENGTMPSNSWRKHKYSTLEYYSYHTTNQPRTQQNVHIHEISKLIFHVPFLQKLLGPSSRHEAVDRDGKERSQDSNWDQAEKEASHKAPGENATAAEENHKTAEASGSLHRIFTTHF